MSEGTTGEPREKHACLYDRAGELIVGTEARTTDGSFIAQAPVKRLSTSCSADEIGAAVREVLNGFRDGIPHPESLSNVGAEFLRAAGFRSWRALERGSKLCHVNESEDGSCELYPTRNGGTRGPSKGFEPLEAGTVELDAHPTDAEIGDAVRAALGRCE